MRAVSLLLFLGACASRPVQRYPYEQHVDPIIWKFDCAFPDSSKETVRRAFAYWDDLVPAHLFREIPCKLGSKLTVTVVLSGEIYHKDGEPRPQTWGTAFSGVIGGQLWGGEITLYPLWAKSNDELFRQDIVRHEVGHILGFGHSTWPVCLMFPWINAGKLVYDWKLKPACEPEIFEIRGMYGGPMDPE